jgi:hypothetical protein
MHDLVRSFLHDIGCPLCVENVELFVLVFLPDIKDWFYGKGLSVYAAQRAIVWRKGAAPQTHEEFAQMSEAFLESWNSLNARDKSIIQKTYNLRNLRVTFWLEEPDVVLLAYIAHSLEKYVDYVCSEVRYSCPHGRVEFISALRKTLLL